MRKLFGSAYMDHYQMLRAVSRTFALSIEQLPPVLREAVTTAYLMFRVADCLEDHDAMDAQRKADMLRLWARIVTGESVPSELTGSIMDLDGSDPETYVAQHADAVITQLHRLPDGLREILICHVRDTSLGMARWQEHGSFVADEEEMDDYMHQVAGRVGYLLTDVFSWYSPAIHNCKERLMPLGREFGLALQTVNIIRGMPRDYERGWVFVPVSFFEKAGLTREGMFDPANRQKALAVVNMVAEKAQRHLEKGLCYIQLLPRRQNRIRLFCIWPLLFAVKTLAISRSNVNVLTDEVKITRSKVKQIVFSSKLFSWSNLCIAAYYRSLSRPEEHAEKHR